MKYTIGVDLGTTLAKCVIYDQEGNAVSEAGREMDIKYPAAGIAEQDALDFYTVSCSMLSEVLAASGINKSDIAGIKTMILLHITIHRLIQEALLKMIICIKISEI
jgi:glycerol kinase